MRRALRRRAIAAGTTLVVGALVVGVAAASEGYVAEQLDLSDPSVWVADGDDGRVGRVNTVLGQLDTVLESPSESARIVQAGGRVWLHDAGAGTLTELDPATATTTTSISLPTGSDELTVVGDRLVLHAPTTGDVWVLPVAAAATLGPDSPPTLELGPGSAIAVDAERVTGYSATSTQVVSVPLADPAGRSVETLRLGSPGDAVSVGTAGGQWAVYDETTAELATRAGVVSLAGLVAPGSEIAMSAIRDSDRVLIAHTTGLLAMPTDGGAPEVLVDGRAGSPVTPVRVAGCDYTAWGDGAWWRGCGAASGTGLLADIATTGIVRLAFAIDRERVVLNDTASGAVWAVQTDAARIDDWETAQDEVVESDEETPSDDTEQPLERRQRAPEAADDDLGARAGRSTVLPVLLNDSDANGDALTVDKVAVLAGPGTAEPMIDGSGVLLRLDQGAAGQTRLRYRITDGRGGTDEAIATVTIVPDDVNHEPDAVASQVRRLGVVAGGRTERNVLGAFLDPDGDPITLIGASITAGSVIARPNGSVLIGADDRVGTAVLSVVVSDGRAMTTGRIPVDVGAVGQVPIELEPFGVRGEVGEAITVRPLEHANGGSAALRLHAVSDAAGVTTNADFAAGSFTVTATTPGVRYVEYSVSDGDTTEAGRVRVDVEAPRDAAGEAPIAVPDAAFAVPGRPVTIAPLDNDVDPSGSVLVLASIDDPDRRALRVEVLEGRLLRLTLLDGGRTAPLELEYTVSNGAAQATSTVTVVPVPAPSTKQPPVATDDTATVRVGGVADIAVLANDLQADGLELSLDPDHLTALAAGSGLLFASDDRVRFVAPDEPGTVQATYRVVDEDGDWDEARLTIDVVEADAAANAAPTPPQVTARVFAGRTVRIPIPLAGSDPDGGEVTLLSQQLAPEKGTVTDAGADWIEYTAGAQTAGTDRFEVQVVDDLGAVSTGTIAVGITAAVGNPPPVAAEDRVAARPGGTVTVDVLANDSDPQGGVLEVDPDAFETVGALDPTAVSVVDGLVRVAVPSAATGALSVRYGIRNDHGGVAASTLVIEVDPQAPLSRPELADRTLTLADVLGREEVTVDLLDGAFLADGDAADLGLAVVDGWADDVRIDADGTMRIPVLETARVIPYTAANPQEESLRSTALVRVPGLEDAAPQLDRTRATPTVVSGRSIDIEVADHVLTATGRAARLVGDGDLSALHGQAVALDEDTVRFTADGDWFGPASITMLVTDGPDDADTTGRTATIVLPITVQPTENQPPVFQGTSLGIEPGQQLSVGLLPMTAYPYQDDLDALSWRIEAVPAGFSARIDGDVLVVSAPADAEQGQQVRIPVAVRDLLNEGVPGAVELTVVASSRPLAVAVPDRMNVRRGATQSLDVLANDQSTNPFPDEPLRVTAVRGDDAADLPAGVSLRVSNDSSRLVATVAADAAPQDITVLYRIEDATGQRDRAVWGTATIRIQDVPDAPAAPVQTVGDAFQAGSVTLQVTPPASNNAPISGYAIVADDGYRHECGASTTCVLDDLVIGASYEFRAVAVNEVGESAPSAATPRLTADYLPAAPASVTATSTTASQAPSGRSITVSWTAVPDPRPGTPVRDYVIVVDGLGSVVRPAGSTSVVLGSSLMPGIQNGVSYTVTVYARNSAQVRSSADWRSATSTVTAVGPPSSVRDPAPSAAVNLQDADGSIVVTWGSADGNGRAVTYSIARLGYDAAIPECTPAMAGTAKPGQLVDGLGPNGSYVDRTAVDDGRYTYVVYADNGRYCSATSAGRVTSLKAPGQASAVVEVQPRGDTGYFDLVVVQRVVATGTAERYQVRLDADAWTTLTETEPRWVTGPEATPSRYGVPTTVQVRGCRPGSDQLCGQASPASETLVPMATRAQVTACVVGTAPELRAPTNRDAETSYVVGYRIGGEWTAIDASATDAVPDGADGIRVRATVTAAGQTRSDPGYAEASCDGAP